MLWNDDIMPLMSGASFVQKNTETWQLSTKSAKWVCILCLQNGSAQYNTMKSVFDSMILQMCIVPHDHLLLGNGLFGNQVVLSEKKQTNMYSFEDVFSKRFKFTNNSLLENASEFQAQAMKTNLSLIPSPLNTPMVPIHPNDVEIPYIHHGSGPPHSLKLL